MASTLFADLVINGESVPHTVIAAEVQNHNAPRAKAAAAWNKAANAVAVRTLLLQEARRRGIEPQPVEQGPGRYETDEEALIRGLLENTIDIAPPNDEAVREYWQRDPSKFRAPPLWEVSHILIVCDPRNRKETRKTESRALEVLGLVQANPGDFVKLASQYSECGSRSSGGALGQLGPGDSVPEFEAALLGMKNGDILDKPVLTRHGWHIIKMDAYAPGEILPYKVVKPKISDAMEKAAWAKRAKGFIADLVEQAEISGIEMQGKKESG